MDIESPNDIAARYRHLRAINIRHHTEALDVLSGAAILAQAKRLGLTDGKTIVADEEELPFVFDLALYTAPPGRARAIDRYARASACKTGSEEGQMLAAMQAARFSIWQVEDRHEMGGIILRDLVRDEGEVWLMDEGLNLTASPGLSFAARLFRSPDGFAMTCGIVVSVYKDLLEAVFDACGCIADKAPHDLAEDRRFAAALYQLAIEEDGFRAADRSAA